MDNFDQESGQQQYANDSGLNVFLAKYMVIWPERFSFQQLVHI